MKIALLDFHRKKHNRIEEAHKIKTALEVHKEADVDIFKMLDSRVPSVSLGKYGGFVLGGADSNYVERYPGYRAAKNLIGEAIERGNPVLGVCAGHQLLGNIHNWTIDMLRNGPEAGWYEIFLTEEGTNDPLFKTVSGRFISFQSHIKYAIPDEKSGHTILARNENCIQAFKYRENVYGIQFHPEDTIEQGEALIRNYDRRPPTEQHRVGTPVSLEVYRVFQNFMDIVIACDG